MNQGQTGPALAALEAARDIDPDHAEALDALSRYWTKTESLADAADAAERLAQRPGYEVRGEVRLAKLRASLFDPHGAATALADALHRDPDLKNADLDPASARVLLVRSLLRAGRPAEARREIARLPAKEKTPDPESAWLLSRALLQEHKNAEAIDALKQAGDWGRSDPMAPEPAPYAGAAACANCHAGEYQTQQRSRHSRTLVRTENLPALPWPAAAIVDADNPRVTHQIERSGHTVDIETRMGSDTYRAVLLYAIGSNHHGQSFLGARSQARFASPNLALSRATRMESHQ